MITEPFCFLSDVSDEQLASVLAAQRDEVAAIVLSEIPVSRVPGVYARLPPKKRSNVRSALRALTPVDFVVREQVAEELARRVFQLGGPTQVARILQSCEPECQAEALKGLGRLDREAAERVQSQVVGFVELASMSDHSFRRLLCHVDRSTLAMALKHSCPEVSEKVRHHLRSSEVHALNEEMSYLGSVTGAEVDGARERILNVARRLLSQQAKLVEFPRGHVRSI